MPIPVKGCEKFKNRKMSKFGKRLLDVSPRTKELLRKFLSSKSSYRSQKNWQNSGPEAPCIPSELSAILKLLATSDTIETRPLLSRIYLKLSNRQEVRCLLLILVILLYTIFGALMFQATERSEEKSSEQLAIERNTSKTIAPSVSASSYTWNSLGSAFYAVSIYTTIGYGNIVCKTDLGKILTIFYALFGIPLMVTVLNEVGKLICSVAEKVWKLWNRIRKKLGLLSKSDNASAPSKSSASDLEFPLVLVLCVTLVVYMLLCAKVFQLWEPKMRDSYLDAFYFVFISMSTIGFGDIVAETPSHAMTGLIFFLFGLSLVSMFVQLMNRKLEEQYLAAMELLEAVYLGNQTTKENKKEVKNALKGIIAQQVAFGFIIQKTDSEDVSEADKSQSETISLGSTIIDT